jgi:hypothetical protein
VRPWPRDETLIGETRGPDTVPATSQPSGTQTNLAAHEFGLDDHENTVLRVGFP